MKDIKEIAKKLGYEVVDKNIFLPLGSFRGWEYGLSIEGEELRVYAKDEEIKYGESISCFTAHSLIKTLEFGKREFLIQRKDSEIENKRVGLLYAFKNPELQLDSSIKTKILRGAAVIIPEGQEILQREILDLQDKISEAKEISSIPGYENILKNLNKELCELADSYFSLGPEKIRINEIIIEGDFEYAGDEMKGGNLVVKGGVKWAGKWMEGGNLVVGGNVEYAGDRMKGGTLVVKGDVEYAGWFMKGGDLVVNGDVKGYAGYKMKGGKIAIYGMVDHIYDDVGSRIYIDLDKNPGHVRKRGVRPIEEFDGGLNERH
jgi:formylmethanofuran dehydrogenase subunit C